MRWEKLKEEKYRAGYRRMAKKTFRLPSGEVTDFDVVNDPDSVAIVVVTKDQQVVTVKQFRPGPEEELWELAGGFIDTDETPEQAARREAREETGYEGKLIYLGPCWRSAYSTTRTYQFVMIQSEHVQAVQLDPHEVVEVTAISKQEFLDLLERGDLTDPGTGFKAAKHLGWL